MDTEREIQTAFTFRDDRGICLDFEGGEITSDAGLIARRTLRVLNEFDHRIAFTDSVAACLDDDRHPSYLRHELAELLIQRLYRVVAGYQDQKDAQLLRADGLSQMIAGNDLGEPLASQPSLSRFGNLVSASEVGALNDLLTDSFIVHHTPPIIIIDVDGTDDPAHGQQQLIGFNGFCNQYVYHPVLIHEGLTGSILGTFLRPGNAHDSENILCALEPIITRLRQAYPYAVMWLRADAGLATPRLYNFCESHQVGFTIGIAANAVFKRASDALQQQAVEQY